MGNEGLQLEYVLDPNPADVAVLFDGINEAAIRTKGLKGVESGGFFIKNDRGDIIAGLTAFLFYGCLWIDMLWVHESWRKGGLGTKLMQAAETLGRDRNFAFAIVHTMDWEALPFYQKLKYEIEFIREGFEKNSKMYGLRKNLKN